MGKSIVLASRVVFVQGFTLICSVTLVLICIGSCQREVGHIPAGDGLRNAHSCTVIASNPSLESSGDSLVISKVLEACILSWSSAGPWSDGFIVQRAMVSGSPIPHLPSVLHNFPESRKSDALRMQPVFKNADSSGWMLSGDQSGQNWQFSRSSIDYLEARRLASLDPELAVDAAKWRLDLEEYGAIIRFRPVGLVESFDQAIVYAYISPMVDWSMKIVCYLEVKGDTWEVVWQEVVHQ